MYFCRQNDLFLPNDVFNDNRIEKCDKILMVLFQWNHVISAKNFLLTVFRNLAICRSHRHLVFSENIFLKKKTPLMKLYHYAGLFRLVASCWHSDPAYTCCCCCFLKSRTKSYLLHICKLDTRYFLSC